MAPLADRLEDVREQAALCAAYLTLPYLDPDQVGFVVKTSGAFVRAACRRGELPALKLGSKCWRIRPCDLAAWQASVKK